MPTFVMKVSRDRDQYIGWSTVVESIVWIANDRTKALEILARDTPRGYLPEAGHTPHERLCRADETGTSALYPRRGPFDGAWEDQYQIVEQRGLLARADLPAFVDAFEADDMERAYRLLRPFEDDAALPPETGDDR